MTRLLFVMLSKAKHLTLTLSYYFQVRRFLASYDSAQNDATVVRHAERSEASHTNFITLLSSEEILRSVELRSE